MPLEPKQEPPYYEITTGPEPAGTKYYTALLTQTGTANPVATILQNTIGTITLTRESPGTYSMNGTNIFTLNKTIMPPFSSDFLGNAIVALPLSDNTEIIGYWSIQRINEDQLYIETRDQVGLLTEWSTLIDATPMLVQIIVYPT